MPLIQPFAGLRPRPEYAAAVVAPPYDVLDTEEARARAADNPWSFLHISRPEIDFPAGTTPAAPGLYARGKESLMRMIEHEVLQYDHESGYYVYELRMGTHTQTGLVVAASVAAYEDNRIRKHEDTRAEKVDDRAQQIEALNAHTGPVAMIYRHTPLVDSLIQTAAQGDPKADVTTDAGVRHCLWVVREPGRVRALSSAVEHLDVLYIADGHHRTAAAARVATTRRTSDGAARGKRAADYFLAVIFPDNQMQLLEYNRVVADLNGLAPKFFVDRLHAAFTIEPVDTALKPKRAGQFGMYLAGQWYCLSINPDRLPSDTRARLDVNLLADNVLAPILGIAEEGGTDRVDFVGAARGLGELERRVDSNEVAVAFSLYPTSMHDLLAIADAGQVMPPKSTWFEPKLADGLVSHVLD